MRGMKAQKDKLQAKKQPGMPARTTKTLSMAQDAEAENFYEAVYRLVRAIPKGRLMTYGQIAVILGHPRAARAVGYALRAS
mgnify:CR=1 FL=1